MHSLSCSCSQAGGTESLRNSDLRRYMLNRQLNACFFVLLLPDDKYGISRSDSTDNINRICYVLDKFESLCVFGQSSARWGYLNLAICKLYKVLNAYIGSNIQRYNKLRYRSPKVQLKVRPR